MNSYQYFVGIFGSAMTALLVLVVVIMPFCFLLAGPGRTREIAGKIIGNAGVLTTIAFVGAVGMQYTW
ncbi:MAG: hypothetical protein AAB794_03555 [Patescibacteria group bacterium]